MINISQLSKEFFNKVSDRKTPDGEALCSKPGTTPAVPAPGADPMSTGTAPLGQPRPTQLMKRVFERHHPVNYDAPPLKPNGHAGAAAQDKSTLQTAGLDAAELGGGSTQDPEEAGAAAPGAESKSRPQQDGKGGLEVALKLQRSFRAAGPANVASEPDLITQTRADHKSGQVSEADWAAAAESLHCSPSVLKALYATEAHNKPFDAQGRPTMYFQRDKFSFLTHHRFDRDHPGVSGPAYVPNARLAADGDFAPREDIHGSPSQQYLRLAQAAELDENNALQASAWGACQLSGSHYLDCGCASVQDFVRRMGISEASQLQLFANFCATRLDTAALNDKSWRSVAGSLKQGATDKQIAAYAKRLEANYRKFVY